MLFYALFKISIVFASSLNQKKNKLHKKYHNSLPCLKITPEN